MVGFFCVLVTATFSDRFKARGPFVLGGCLFAIIGYAMLLGAKENSVRYGGTFLVAVGVSLKTPFSSAGKSVN